MVMVAHDYNSKSKAGGLLRVWDWPRLCNGLQASLDGKWDPVSKTNKKSLMKSLCPGYSPRFPMSTTPTEFSGNFSVTANICIQTFLFPLKERRLHTQAFWNAVPFCSYCGSQVDRILHSDSGCRHNRSQCIYNKVKWNLMRVFSASRIFTNICKRGRNLVKLLNFHYKS